MENKTDEKRRFFRINDKIGINYKVLDKNTTQEKKRHRVDLQSLLSVNDERVEQILLSLQGKDAHVVELIKLMNKKINLLAGYLEIERGRVDDVEYIIKNVNISACGLAFMSDEKLDPGTELSVELLLGGDSSPLEVEGVVVSCDKKTERQYYLRINFENISGTDQEVLIQYMVKRQSELLREMLSKTRSESTAGSVN